MIELWAYQQQAVQHVLKKMVEGCIRMYVTLPTGTGKSIILVAIAALRVLHGRVLVLIHRQDIAVQLVKALRGADLDVGLIMQGHRELEASVIVATPQSLSSDTLSALISANGSPIATVLIDEAHHAVQGSAYAYILQQLEAVYYPVPIVTIGFTATPYRSDTRSMFSILPTCAFARDIPDMVLDGYLSPLIWESLRVKFDVETVPIMLREGEIDYDENTLAAALDITALTEALAQDIVTRIGQRPTLLFAASVSHAEHFAEAFRHLGVNACAVSGKQRFAERERVFADWRSGVVQIVCNCSLLTEGYDFPAISALIIARPTLSVNLYTQMLGRGMRTAPGKENCLVLDVMGNDPDLSRQVVLPHIVGDTQGQGGQIPSRKAASDPLLKALYGTHSTSLSLLDPIGLSQFRWLPYLLKDRTGYFAKISQYERAIIERDPEGSGLYRSRLYEKRPKQEATNTWIEHHYLPLRQQVALVQESTDARYSKALGSKEAGWLHQQATEKQLQTLQCINPQVAQQARDKEWTKECVSNLIMFLPMKRTLINPPPVPQEERNGSVD